MQLPPYENRTSVMLARPMPLWKKDSGTLGFKYSMDIIGDFAIFRHAVDGNAGTFTQGAWTARDLNETVVNEITGASLDSNKITLPAGIFRIKASAPGFVVKCHRIRLWNNTDSSADLLGTSEASGYWSASRLATSCSMIIGYLTLTAAKDFYIQHRCSRTQSVFGLGKSAAFSGVDDVYSIVEIEKIIGGEYAVFCEEQSSGTDGGDIAGETWTTRVLNTTDVNTITGASLSSNKITLPTGTYYIDASAPAFTYGVRKARLRDITGGTTLLNGGSCYAVGDDEGHTQTRSIVSGYFMLSGTKELEIQQWIGASSEQGRDMGVASGFGVNERYSLVEVIKVG